MSDEPKDAIRADKSAIVAALREAGADMRNEKSFKCPFHEDKSPSAGLYLADDGAWRIKCQAASCGFCGDVFDVREKHTGKPVDDQLAELRTLPKPSARKRPAQTWPSIGAWERSFPHRVATYRYTNPETGKVDLLKCRIEPPGEKKTFRQARVDDAGTVHGEAPPHPHPIYNRTRIKSASEVIVVEGEKCVEALNCAGWVATTAPTGGGPGKAVLSDWKPLAGKIVYLWPDHDPVDAKGVRAGHQFMRDIAEQLRAVEPPVTMWWIDPAKIGLKDKEDAFDYLARYPEREAAVDAMSDVIDIATLIDGANELRAHIGEIIAGKRTNQRIKTFPETSRLVRALLPGCVMVLVGDPGTTKSMMVTQWLQDLILCADCPSACFMLEEDRKYHLMRCLAQMANNSNLTIEEWIKANPDIAESELETYADSIGKLSKAIFDAPDSTMNYEQLAEWVDVNSAKSRVLFIDPITAIDPGRDPWNTERKFMASAKAALRRNQASLVIVTHPRGGKSNGTVDDVAGSRAFGRFAQSVLLLKRLDEPRTVTVQHQYGSRARIEIDRELRLLKVRNSVGQGTRIGLSFDVKSLRFIEHGAFVPEKRAVADDN